MDKKITAAVPLGGGGGKGRWSRMPGLTIEPRCHQKSCARAAPFFLNLIVTVPAVKTLYRTAGQIGRAHV